MEQVPEQDVELACLCLRRAKAEGSAGPSDGGEGLEALMPSGPRLSRGSIASDQTRGHWFLPATATTAAP